MAVKRKSNRRTLGCLSAVFALLLIAIVFMLGGFFWQFIQHNTIRERITFEVPTTSIQLEHSRIGIHPMMAEYERDITFVDRDQRSKTHPLAIDTCGGYPINCYLINASDGPFLRLDDAVSEHLLDLDRQRVYLVAGAMGRSFVGRLNKSDLSHGWSMTNGDPSTLRVTIGGEIATPMDDLTGDAEEKYIGRIDGKAGRLRFIPASKSPERKIDNLFE